ncbi:uncharacterized protein LOC111371053 [Olea europaea var. sylvestris]|uniref:uncharacterized protein LOC111371052 n=1 Tax=Olea europaea var. sylvestris TaxID=158386 RepID=UPI000C1D4675|nr:uncharacterized protein LOC111371052 [Olea europaea var. sylvestris]XP_022848740.1 uncharacterized protein LOC111371053 [Olea europaea var. sylvestris]
MRDTPTLFETRYPDIKKLALSLVIASRKLRPYFQAYSIEVLTNFLLKQRHQGQILTDFVAKFTKAPKIEATMDPAELPTWKLFVDGLSGESGSEVGVILESPEGHRLNCAIRFSFKVSNNSVEYETLLASLRLAKEMKVRKLKANSDLQLVVSQVNGRFIAKDSGMAANLKLVLSLVPHLQRFELVQVPSFENTHADVFSKLANSKDSELLRIVPIEHLSKTSISGDQSRPPLKNEAKKLRRRAAYFILQDDVLYKRGFSSPLLQYVGGEEAMYILREIHEGVCSNHSGGTALAHKGLFMVTSPWPFTKWGIDFIGPLSKGRRSATFAVVAIDYFTKWVEAEPLAKITEANTTKFV